METSLDVRQNEPFQARESRLERVGWVLLTLFVVAGLAGLLGAGPLSSSTASSSGGAVSVDYDRLIHVESDTSVTLRFGAQAVADGVIEVTLEGSWVSGVDLQGISPEPLRQSAVPRGLVFRIAVHEPGATELALNFRARSQGSLDLTVSTAGESVHFTQFVLP